MNERKIIEAALGGEAIVFLGAGFSSGATNFTEDGEFLVGSGLCNSLIEDGNIDISEDSQSDISDLQYISTRYLENNTARDLIRLLKSLFCCKAVGKQHEIIANIPWKKIYTTNYDDVMEVASKNVSRNREAVVAKNKISEVYSRKNAIIHINGYINTVTEDELQDGFKLTQESYRNRTLSDSDWAVALHTDIKISKAVVFIGYSLDYDLELQQIFACDEKLKEKCLFVDLNPSRRKRTSMEKFGTVFPDGVKAFSELINSVNQEYQKEEKTYNFKCIKETTLPSQIVNKVNSDDVISLFIDGEMKESILYSPFQYDYLFKRDCVDQIYNFLIGEGKVAIIHSDLFNGKSMVLKQLEIELRQKGSVYTIKDIVDESLADDLEYISSQKGMHFILVENYNQIIESEAWKVISTYKYSNIKYLFTARSYINDNFYGRVVKDLQLTYENLGMFDINELKDNDITKFIALISKYGLWGDRYTKNNKQQYSFIAKRCNREIRNVLLEVYKSSAVKEKIDKLIDCIVKDDLAKQVLLFSFIGNILSIPVEIDDMAIALGINNINKLFFDKYHQLKEILILDGNKLRIKSSSISSYVIQNGKYNDDVLEIINSMVCTYCKHSYSQRYATMLKCIISFSNLRLIFNCHDKKLKEKYIRFYENARKTGYYDNNQFFWIQYAIAVMEIKDYGAAEIYLKNASALSQKKINEDSYQVDSLRARLFLERTIYENDVKNAFDNFSKAHKLICSNKTPDRHYPYRQASPYVDFYKKFYDSFSKEEKVSFMFMCTEMMKKINTYLTKDTGYEKNIRKRNYFIKAISDNLQLIINDMVDKSE